MIKIIIKVISWITFIASLIGTGYLTYLYMLNPDMTRMRFFLTYWWQELLCIITLIISKAIIDCLSRKELFKAFKSLNNKDKI